MSDEAEAVTRGRNYDRMATMLRRLDSHWRSNYHCCWKSKHRSGGHDDDCIMLDLATLLRDLP